MASLLHFLNPSILTPSTLCFASFRVKYTRRPQLNFSSLRSRDIFVTSTARFRICSSSRVQDRGERVEEEDHLNVLADSTDTSTEGEMHFEVKERDFTGTPYVPVYVMLPPGLMNMECKLVDPDYLREQLETLKEANVDGVTVDCWWGIVEAHTPKQYNWKGYKELFQIVQDLNLKLQVVMSFHECGGNVGDTLHIPLPKWVKEVGEKNPDIYFTDQKGNRNQECLTWGIDNERVLRGRTAIEVYYDYMKSFCKEFGNFLKNGVISEIEIGLGPCGELRYPSYPKRHGWKYPGIGAFQCYDKYLIKSLEDEAEAIDRPSWGKGPGNAGYYNSRPHEAVFFFNGGAYDSCYGDFFLDWYSQVLIDHGNNVLKLAKFAFKGTPIASKLSGIPWWYKTESHAAELTAGYYNVLGHNGYARIATMFKRHNTALNFKYVELRTSEDFPEALADPKHLFRQVYCSALDVDLPIASENAPPCYNREEYNKILENSKPFNDKTKQHLSAFTYVRLNSDLLRYSSFTECLRFVNRMHGEACWIT